MCYNISKYQQKGANLKTKMNNKIEKFLNNKKYKLATIKQDNNFLIYVDNLKAWETDTQYGEYDESDDISYKKIVVIIEGSGFKIEDEHNCIGKKYNTKPLVSDYNNYANNLSVGSTVQDLHSFIKNIVGTTSVYIPYEYMESKKILRRKDLKLCYIENSVAYFTNNENIWGDDWNDSPYQYNAGTPYEEEGFEIYSIGFCTNNIYLEPCNYFYPKNFSVEQINHKIVPWLIPDNIEYPPIFSGETINEFVKKIKNASGYILYGIKFENYI